MDFRCKELSERVERGDSERVRIEGDAKQERQVAEGKVAELVQALRGEAERGEAAVRGEKERGAVLNLLLLYPRFLSEVPL